MLYGKVISLCEMFSLYGKATIRSFPLGHSLREKEIKNDAKGSTIVVLEESTMRNMVDNFHGPILPSNVEWNTSCQSLHLVIF